MGTKENNSKHFYKSLRKLEKINLNKDAGFMLETFQGWGAIFYPEEFVQEISKYVKKTKFY